MLVFEERGFSGYKAMSGQPFLLIVSQIFWLWCAKFTLVRNCKSYVQPARAICSFCFTWRKKSICETKLLVPYGQYLLTNHNSVTIFWWLARLSLACCSLSSCVREIAEEVDNTLIILEKFGFQNINIQQENPVRFLVEDHHDVFSLRGKWN